MPSPCENKFHRLTYGNHHLLLGVRDNNVIDLEQGGLVTISISDLHCTELDLGIDRFGLEQSLEEYLSSHC